MRPVARGASPRTTDFEDYEHAKPELVSRLGPYCSYCERHIVSMLAVEHIQAKDLAAYAHLVGRWDNFLLACVNCNSTKGHKDVQLADHLLPDRDNTFVAYEYLKDGTMGPVIGLAQIASSAAHATWTLVGLDKAVSVILDSNGKQVALDRVSQRMQVWAKALVTRQLVDGNPGVLAVRQMAIELALATGFFSIWMAAFAHDTDMRQRLIAAFPGTAASGCFDPLTTAPVCPAPNPDGLPSGAKV